MAERILDTFEPYAPGTKESVVGSPFQHSLWLGREFGLVRGNVMRLPVEEAVFFLVTNVLVVFGLVISLHPAALERLRGLASGAGDVWRPKPGGGATLRP